MRITFYTHKKIEDIRRVGFYSQDINILKDIGHEVRVTNHLHQLLYPADLYYVWWWTAAAPPVFVGRLLRKPVIVTGVFNYSLPIENGVDYIRRKRWHKALINYALARASANVFVSRFEHGLVPSELEVENPMYIPLTVDAEIFDYADESQRQEALVLNIAWSGKHNAIRKCLHQVVEAMPLVVADVPKAKFVMCGTPGHHHEGLVQRAKELGVERHVEFRGYVGEEEKIRLMQECAVYLSPSLYEGFGLAIAEAMSCGAPVVSSAVGAVPEVTGGSAKLVDGRDVEAIARATIELLKDREERERRGTQGRKRICREYGYYVRRDGLASLIESACG